MQRANSVGTLDSPEGTTLVAKWAGVLEKRLAVCYNPLQETSARSQRDNGFDTARPSPQVERKPSFCPMNDRGFLPWTHTAMQGWHRPAKTESSPAKLCCKALLPAGQAEPRCSLKGPRRINSNPTHHGPCSMFHAKWPKEFGSGIFKASKTKCLFLAINSFQ